VIKKRKPEKKKGRGETRKKPWRGIHERHHLWPPKKNPHQQKKNKKNTLSEENTEGGIDQT